MTFHCLSTVSRFLVHGPLIFQPRHFSTSENWKAENNDHQREDHALCTGNGHMSAKHGLRYLHLPYITPFTHASTIQNTLVSRVLEHKALLSSPSLPTPAPHAPPPTILTFVPTPVYTLGRRETDTLSAAQIAALKEPLITKIQPPRGRKKTEEQEHATVVQTLRGGQVTFHGPGQLLIYPILDIKAVRSPLWPNGLTARCYVNVLEEATIRLLDKWYPHIKGIRTANPGIWVNEDKKIAALGVHLRRNVASFGVGLNLSTDLRWFDRIVACGLEGKKMTTLENEGETLGSIPRKVAKRWAEEFAACLWGEETVVERMAAQDMSDLVSGMVVGPFTKERVKWKPTGEQEYQSNGWPVPPALEASSLQTAHKPSQGKPKSPARKENKTQRVLVVDGLVSDEPLLKTLAPPSPEAKLSPLLVEPEEINRGPPRAGRGQVRVIKPRRRSFRKVNGVFIHRVRESLQPLPSKEEPERPAVREGAERSLLRIRHQAPDIFGCIRHPISLKTTTDSTARAERNLNLSSESRSTRIPGRPWVSRKVSVEITGVLVRRVVSSQDTVQKPEDHDFLRRGIRWICPQSSAETPVRSLAQVLERVRRRRIRLVPEALLRKVSASGSSLIRKYLAITSSGKSPEISAARKFELRRRKHLVWESLKILGRLGNGSAKMRRRVRRTGPLAAPKSLAARNPALPAKRRRLDRHGRRRRYAILYKSASGPLGSEVRAKRLEARQRNLRRRKPLKQVGP